MTATGSTTPDLDRNVRRALEGTVTSSAMEKTITVEVERTYKHKKYGKFVRKAKKYHAHDETSQANTGDRVEIMACRPYSKTKRWRLVRILEKSRLVDAVEFTVDGQVADASAGEAGAGQATGQSGKTQAGQPARPATNEAKKSASSARTSAGTDKTRDAGQAAKGGSA